MAVPAGPYERIAFSASILVIPLLGEENHMVRLRFIRNDHIRDIRREILETIPTCIFLMYIAIHIVTHVFAEGSR